VVATAQTHPIGAWMQRLLHPKASEPGYPKLPEVDDHGQSSVPGLYLAGEVAGTPLVKLGLNQGWERVDAILDGVALHDDDNTYDLVIIGGGPAGLGALARAHAMGAKVLLLEAERIAQTVERMYKGKLLFAEPVDVRNQTPWWFEECRREELLQKWREQLDASDYDVREGEKLVGVTGKSGAFAVQSSKQIYKAKRVLLAIGKAGNPRKVGAAGEDVHAAKVLHHVEDPFATTSQQVCIVGGGDVSCEAAIALASPRDGASEAPNDVTLLVRSDAFVHPKKRNVDRVLELADQGHLSLHFSSRLQRIEVDAVVFKDADGVEHRRDNDVVYEMVGAELPLALFKKMGIRLEGAWTPFRVAALLFSSVFVYSLYALKKFPDAPYSWPFYKFWTPQEFADVVRPVFDVTFAPFAWVFEPSALQTLRSTLWFQTGYLYSLLYTVLMLVFGVMALKRWSGINKNKPEEKRRYQKWRYVSLIGFQVVFFLVANVIAVHAIGLSHGWRAWGLYQPWPLFFNTFHWFDLNRDQLMMAVFGGAGLVGTFVVIPLLSRFHGKRFCTWVCGCGGLAETLGDRWRHLAPKGRRSRAWEFQGVVILVFALIATVVTVGMFGTRADNGWALAYSYIVDFWLVAVIPIALYPFYGGKVWCRYWCPLAAYNGLLAKWFGKLNIKSNDKCISCTQCSRFCQVGVDVMDFAKNEVPFDNANSACIQCGICIDVCPMDVLSFDSTPRAKRELKILQ